jgi:hypothetical protein
MKELSLSSFFRVFDVAFFIPGLMVIVFLLLLCPEHNPFPIPLQHNVDQNIHYLLIGIYFVIGSYIAGIIIHAIGSIPIISDQLSKIKFEQSAQPNNINNIATKSEFLGTKDMRLYFWNMSTVCKNAGIAALVVGLIMAIGILTCSKKSFFDVYVIAIAIATLTFFFISEQRVIHTFCFIFGVLIVVAMVVAQRQL